MLYILCLSMCSVQNKAHLPYWKNDSTGPPSAWQNGWHGYDNDFRDMGGFFLAAGPGTDSTLDLNWLNLILLQISQAENNLTKSSNLTFLFKS